MNIPFIDTGVAGLYLGETELVWVAATRRGRSTLRHPIVDREPVEGDVDEALHRLIARVQPSRPYVYTHLAPFHLRHRVVQGPSLDDPLAFDTWIQAEAQHHLPPGASLKDFVLRFHTLEEGEGYTRGLLAMVSRGVVTQWLSLLSEVGLEPLSVTSIDVAVGEALMLNEAVVTEQTTVAFSHEQEMSLLTYEGGLLKAIETVPAGTASADATILLQQIALHVEPSSVLITGTEAAHLEALAQETALLGNDVRQAVLDLPGTTSSSWSDPAFVPAVSLVVPLLFSRPRLPNFVEPAVVQERQQAQEKQHAMRAILGIGAVLGLLYLLLTIVSFYLGHQADAAEATLFELNDQVTRIEKRRRELKQLEHHVAQAEQLVTERTQIAEKLARIGLGAGDTLWLDAVTFDTSREVPKTVTISGMAFSERDIAAYLHHLEKIAIASQVRLLYSESVRTQTIYKQAQDHQTYLLRFEIQLPLTEEAEGL